jgi:hypothetical protein
MEPWRGAPHSLSTAAMPRADRCEGDEFMRRNILWLLGALGVVALVAGPAGAKGSGCKKAASSARKACKLEAKADGKLAEGVCAVGSEGSARKTCQGEARAEAKEVLGECSEIHEARLDVCEALDENLYAPELDPASFVAVIDNAYAPYPVGAHWVYEGMTDEGLERVEVDVLAETRTIEGIVASVIQDRVFIGGELVEDTVDWLAQDVDGNVWYLGEVAKNFENDKLADLDGSWEHGENDAVAGYWMIGNPTLGDVYRQEMLLGEAEDVQEVIGTDEAVDVPAGSFAGCVRTRDFTPLEPDGLEHKFHCPGVGFVREVKPETGEMLELIEYSLP